MVQPAASSRPRSRPRPPVSSPTPLLDAVLDLAGALPTRQQRVARRLLWLALGWALTLGRHTLTRALAALGLVDADWSAWCRLFSRGRFPEAAAAARTLAATLPLAPADRPYVVAVDGTILFRHSRTMPGASWWPAPATAPFARGLRPGQRHVGIHWLAPPTETGHGRAVPLRLLPAFAPSAAPSGLPPRREWEAARDAVAWVRAELDAAGRAAQPLVVVGDGAYDRAPLLRALPERTVLVVRTARNRALFALPDPAAPRRRYGARLPTPADVLTRKTGWDALTLQVRGRPRHLRAQVAGPLLVKPASARPCFLVAVRGVDHGAPRRRAPWHGLVTAVPDGAGGWTLPADLATVLGWAWQRWEVEVAHRELKTTLGLGESPAWSAAGTVALAQWVVWLHAVLLLAGIRVWGMGRAETARTARWWPGGARWSLGQLLQGLRAELAEAGGYRPVCTAMPPTRGGLPPPQLLCNAVLAADRT